MINNVTLVGRLTKACELKFTSLGVAVASFTLAVDSPFKKQNGEKETSFINCVAWKHSAEALANYTDKGHRVGLTGRIQTRSYEGQNGRVYVTEVVAEQIAFLEPKGNTSQQENRSHTGQHKQTGSPFGNEPIEADDLDGLPF